MTVTITWFQSKFIIQILMSTSFNLKNLDIFQYVLNCMMIQPLQPQLIQMNINQYILYDILIQLIYLNCCLKYMSSFYLDYNY